MKTENETQLSYEQTNAVLAPRGGKDILCVAAPGSGKTRTLVARIQNLLVGARINPEHIFVVTFTNSAALVLQERLGNVKLGFIGTLHSLMLRLLAQHGEMIGMHSVSVMDDDTAAEMLEQTRSELRVKCSAKQLKLAVERLRKAIRHMEPLQNPDDTTLVANAFLRKQREEGTLDYDSLLLFGLELLRAGDRNKIKMPWLFVDEFQDSSDIDMDIYHWLPVEQQKFFVGDPDQNIYSFRGTNVQHIINAANDVNVSTFHLSTNYRSGSSIIARSTRLIKHNTQRVEHEVIPAHDAIIGEVTVNGFDDPASEFAHIVSCVNFKHKSMAVLFRTNALVTAATDYLRSFSIPISEAKRMPSTSPEAVTGRAVLAFMANPFSDRAAEQFIARCIPATEAKEIRSAATHRMVSLASACMKYLQREWHRMIFNRDEFGAHWNAFPVVSGEAWTYIKALANTMPEPFTIQELALASTRLQDEPEQVESNGVYVGTVHSAKGREWDVVCLGGAEAELWPGRDEMEEARRLFYVGMTRAREYLHITWCSKRQNPFKHWINDTHHQTQFIEEMK